MKRDALSLILRWVRSSSQPRQWSFCRTHSRPQQPQAPAIKITEVPPSAPGGPDEMFPISGEVIGVEPRDHRVVIYVLAGERGSSSRSTIRR